MKRIAIVAAIAATAFLWFLDQAYRLGLHDGKRIGRRQGFNDCLDSQMLVPVDFGTQR